MWLKDAIIYQVLIDRFAGYDPSRDWRKPVFLGGNLKGLAERLSYLTDLGINTIWLSPVTKTTSYHGYHVTDYYSTEERFGSVEDLKILISQAHKRNIRILLDFVPNHCSREHPVFQAALKDKKSLLRNWFYFKPFSDQYQCFLNFRELPKLNLDYLAARNHIIGAAKYWLALGIDGFRLDHAIGPSHRFWKAFHQEVKSAKPEAALIGEAWLEGIGLSMLGTIQIRYKYLRWLFRFNPWDIQREYIGEFDGVLDFTFRYLITGLIAWRDNPETNANHVRMAMNRHYKPVPLNYCLPSFIENHDMNRFLFDAGQDRNKLKIAMKLQFSLPQPPILYYGTETGLTHEKPVSPAVPFSDLQARKPMPWNALDSDMISFCRELIRERKRLFT